MLNQVQMKRFYPIFFISLIVLISSIVYWKKANYGKYISTDNAYIRGSITNISSRIRRVC